MKMCKIPSHNVPQCTKIKFTIDKQNILKVKTGSKNKFLIKSCIDVNETPVVIALQTIEYRHCDSVV